MTKFSHGRSRSPSGSAHYQNIRCQNGLAREEKYRFVVYSSQLRMVCLPYFSMNVRLMSAQQKIRKYRRMHKPSINVSSAILNEIVVLLYGHGRLYACKLLKTMHKSSLIKFDIEKRTFLSLGGNRKDFGRTVHAHDPLS